MKRAAIIICSAAFFILLGIAGKYDMASEVVYNMDNRIYTAIYNKLGTHNEVKIAEEYLSNKEYYDETYGW